MSVKVKVGRCKICGKETTLTRSKLCIDCAIQRYKNYLTQMITHSGPIWEKYLYYKKLAKGKYPLGYKKKVEGVARRKRKTRT